MPTKEHSPLDDLTLGLGMTAAREPGGLARPVLPPGLLPTMGPVRTPGGRVAIRFAWVAASRWAGVRGPGPTSPAPPEDGPVVVDFAAMPKAAKMNPKRVPRHAVMARKDARRLRAVLGQTARGARVPAPPGAGPV